MTIMVFDDPSCVFVRTRKTGSTSIVQGLLGGRDRAALVEEHGRWPSGAGDRFSFAFVRDPFARLVSCVRMFRDYKASGAADRALRDALDLDKALDVLEDDGVPVDGRAYRSKLRLHLLPLTAPRYQIHRVEFIGRFEHFEADYRRLADRLGVAVDDVPHLRRSSPTDYRPWYSTRLRARAERLYEADLERFGYGFGDGAAA